MHVTISPYGANTIHASGRRTMLEDQVTNTLHQSVFNVQVSVALISFPCPKISSFTLVDIDQNLFAILQK